MISKSDASLTEATGPSHADLELSVLMLSWNTRDLTIRCLESIPPSVGANLTYEVIVVDNGSRDGSAEALAARDDVVLIQNDANKGYAAAVNQAYRASKGSFILLLNSDVELRVDSIALLTQFLRAHPDAAGVAPFTSTLMEAFKINIHSYQHSQWCLAMSAVCLGEYRTLLRGYAPTR